MTQSMSTSRGCIVCLKKCMRAEEDARSNRTACDAATACAAQPCNVICSDTFNGFALRGALTEECRARLMESGVVDHIEDDIRVQACAEDVTWGAKKVGADKSSVAVQEEPEGKGKSKGVGVDADVFVLDTGVEKSHPYLNVETVVSVLDSETEPNDLNGHGTLCAGIIGAWKQEDGMVGVVPGARIHGVKVLDKDGGGHLSDIISGVEEVARFKRENPGKVVVANLSLGGYAGTRRYTALDQEIVEAIERYGITFVVAAGNSSDDSSLYTPAHVKEAITVGSYDKFDRFSDFSNHGLAVDMLAPGTDVFSTTINGKTDTASGTSFAAPFVAGGAALYMVKKGSAQSNAHEVLGGLIGLSKAKLIRGVPPGTPNLGLDVSSL